MHIFKMISEYGFLTLAFSVWIWTINGSYTPFSRILIPFAKLGTKKRLLGYFFLEFVKNMESNQNNSSKAGQRATFFSNVQHKIGPIHADPLRAAHSPIAGTETYPSFSRGQLLLAD